VRVVITVQVNGAPREIPEGSTVTDMLDRLAFRSDRVAVERNREIVARDRWAGTTLRAGDQLEIVQFVGGG
jgi:thiamine biosynthesis protein ThiS